MIAGFQNPIYWVKLWMGAIDLGSVLVYNKGRLRKGGSTVTKGERREQKRERALAKRRRANNRKNLEVIIEAQRQRLRRSY